MTHLHRWVSLARRLQFLIIALALGVCMPAPGSPAAAQTASTAQGGAVSREFLIGRWTDTGDCSDSIDFHADGSFTTTRGGVGRWTLENHVLNFIAARTITTRVSSPDRNTILLTHPDGTQGRSTRCAPATAAMPPLPATVAEALRISTPANRELVIGRWTDNGDCNVTITFHADGRFQAPNGWGRWALAGEQLSFIGTTTVTARARSVGRNRIILLHPDGRIGQSIRC